MPQRERGLFGTIWDALRSPLPPGYGGAPTFGWLLVVLFAVQLFTGILLATVYQASPGLVDESVRHIMRDVSWGWLMRGIHHWASHGMVALCLLQLVRFLLSGRYRGARAGHWYLGLVMAAVIVLLAFGGGLLVWDETAYWRAAHALEELERLPLVGHTLAAIVRGGAELTATTLSRLFTFHALFLPWLLGGLIALNLWFLGRRGGGEG